MKNVFLISFYLSITRKSDEVGIFIDYYSIQYKNGDALPWLLSYEKLDNIQTLLYLAVVLSQFIHMKCHLKDL